MHSCENTSYWSSHQSRDTHFYSDTAHSIETKQKKIVKNNKKKYQHTTKPTKRKTCIRTQPEKKNEKETRKVKQRNQDLLSKLFTYETKMGREKKTHEHTNRRSAAKLYT